MLGGVSGTTFGAVIGGVLAGAAMYGTMLVREKVVVAGVRQVERNAATVVCNARVAEIERAHNDAIDTSVDEAIAAADAVMPTPAEMVARQKICDASLGCRSRRVQ